MPRKNISKRGGGRRPFEYLQNAVLESDNTNIINLFSFISKNKFIEEDDIQSQFLFYSLLLKLISFYNFKIYNEKKEEINYILYDYDKTINNFLRQTNIVFFDDYTPVDNSYKFYSILIFIIFLKEKNINFKEDFVLNKIFECLKPIKSLQSLKIDNCLNELLKNIFNDDFNLENIKLDDLEDNMRNVISNIIKNIKFLKSIGGKPRIKKVIRKY